MSKVQVDKVVNLSDDGAPQLTYGAELPVGYGLTGAGGLNISGVVTAASAVFSGNVTIGGTLTYEDVTNIDSVGVVTARSGVNVSGGEFKVGTAITVGSAGVSTFSGNVNLNGLSSFAGGVGIADSIFHTGDTNTAIRFPSADTITVETAGSERVRVSSAGNVSIGDNDTPDTLLHIQGDQPKLRIESTNALSTSSGTEEIARIEFEAAKSSNRNVAASMRVRQDGTWSTVDDWFSPTAIEFYTQDQSGTEITTPRVTINSTGVIGVGTAEPVARVFEAFTASTSTPSLTWQGGNPGQRFVNEGSELKFGLTSYSPYAYFIQANTSGSGQRQLTLNPMGGSVAIGVTDPPTASGLVARYDSTFAPTLTWNAAGGHIIRDEGSELNFGLSSITPHPFFIQGRTSGSTVRQIAINPLGGNVAINTSIAGNTLNLGDNAGVGVRFHNYTTNNNYYLTVESGDKVSHNVGGSGYYTWITGGSEKVRIDNNGLVQIGQTSPYSATGGGNSILTTTLDNTNRTDLVVSNQNSGNNAGAALVLAAHGQDFILESTGSGNSATGAGVFTISDGASERLRIDGGGKIGIGTVNPGRQFVVVDAAGGGIGVVGTNAGIYMGTSHSGGFSQNHSIARAAANNYHITNSTTGDLCIAAEAAADILIGTSDSGSPTERMRIQSDGGISFGATGPVNAEVYTFQKSANNGGTSGQLMYIDHAGTDDHSVVQVRHRGATGSTYRTQLSFLDDNADQVGSIRSHGSATQYNTSSDYRLKENAVSITDGIERLKTLKPYRFNFKEDPSTTVDGFFAHEVTAVPEAISGEKDGEEMQGMDYGRLTPLLTAALQEAIAEIETLKAKVAALESN